MRLTPKEFDLFVYMARHPNRVLTHAALLEAVWGEASQEQPEYLRVFMGQLRKKLEPDPSNPTYLRHGAVGRVSIQSEGELRLSMFSIAAAIIGALIGTSLACCSPTRRCGANGDSTGGCSGANP